MNLKVQDEIIARGYGYISGDASNDNTNVHVALESSNKWNKEEAYALAIRLL